MDSVVIQLSPEVKNTLRNVQESGKNAVKSVGKLAQDWDTERSDSGKDTGKSIGKDIKSAAKSVKETGKDIGKDVKSEAKSVTKDFEKAGKASSNQESSAQGTKVGIPALRMCTCV